MSKILRFFDFDLAQTDSCLEMRSDAKLRPQIEQDTNPSLPPATAVSKMDRRGGAVGLDASAGLAANFGFGPGTVDGEAVTSLVEKAEGDFCRNRNCSLVINVLRSSLEESHFIK